MKNILLFELKKSIKPIIFWSIAIIVFNVFMFAFFPLMDQQQEAMDLILKNYPKEMLQLFGLANSKSLSTLQGYLPFVFIFMQLIIANHASLVGMKTLSQEESERTADFLFSKPISRNQLFITKIMSNSIELFAIFLVVVASTHVSLIVFVKDVAENSEALSALYISIVLFQGLFFSISLLVSMTTKYVRSTIGYAIGLSFLMYAMYSIKQLIDSQWMSYITPFSYFESATILDKAALDTTFVLVAVVLIISCTLISYLLFKKRDLFII